MDSQWTKIHSEYSCDKCGRDNTYECDVYSHPSCPQILCQEDAEEWDSEQTAEDASGPQHHDEGAATMQTTTSYFLTHTADDCGGCTIHPTLAFLLTHWQAGLMTDAELDEATQRLNAACTYVHPEAGPCELTTPHHHCIPCGFPLAPGVETCAQLRRVS